MKEKELRNIIVEQDENIANELTLTNEFCQPRFSENRNAFIFIRRKK